MMRATGTTLPVTSDRIISAYFTPRQSAIGTLQTLYTTNLNYRLGRISDLHSHFFADFSDTDFSDIATVSSKNRSNATEKT